MHSIMRTSHCLICILSAVKDEESFISPVYTNLSPFISIIIWDEPKICPAGKSSIIASLILIFSPQFIALRFPLKNGLIIVAVFKEAIAVE